MTTNQTIDGVSRELLAQWLAMFEGGIASSPLSALRELTRKYLKTEPATEPQGEPVAWANWKVGSRSYVPYRTVGEARRCVEASEISATQNGPYRVVPLYAEQPSSVAVK